MHTEHKNLIFSIFYRFDGNPAFGRIVIKDIYISHFRYAPNVLLCNT